jgi:hypothetical protein
MYSSVKEGLKHGVLRQSQKSMARTNTMRINGFIVCNIVYYRMHALLVNRPRRYSFLGAGVYFLYCLFCIFSDKL